MNDYDTPPSHTSVSQIGDIPVPEEQAETQNPALFILQKIVDL